MVATGEYPDFVFAKGSVSTLIRNDALIDMSDPVSYTHLDVYKRQECYCENCEKAFRVWLHKKYGTLDELNRVWNTSFWGHTFYDWDDVVL